jgi:hypothetical protein
MTILRIGGLCVVAIAVLCVSTSSPAQERTARQVRQACDDEIEKIKARAELRLARQNDLGPQRSANLARIEHRKQLAKMLPDDQKSQRELAEVQRDLRRETTAYVVDLNRREVAWHVVLRERQFAADRAVIDGILAGTSRSGIQLWPEESARVGAAASRMQGTLREMIHDVEMQDYAAARRFLDDLKTFCRLSVPSQADKIAAGKVPPPSTNQVSLASPISAAND